MAELKGEMELILKDGTRKPVCSECHRVAPNGMKRGTVICPGCRRRKNATFELLKAAQHYAIQQREERLLAAGI